MLRAPLRRLRAGGTCDVASRCSTQHLSFVTCQEVTFIQTSWTKKKTNQFSPSRRLPCDANVKCAAPSGTVQLHVSTDECSRVVVWGDVWRRPLWCVDGVGERLRRHRHADPALWKRGEAVSSLLAWRRIRCLPHLRGMLAKISHAVKHSFFLQYV